MSLMQVRHHKNRVVPTEIFSSVENEDYGEYGLRVAGTFIKL